MPNTSKRTKKRPTSQSPNCPDCDKPLSPHQQAQGVLVCPVCRGEFRKCTYRVTDRKGKEGPECGGWLRWNTEDGCWLCGKCGKQFGEQSRRNPVPDVAAEIRKVDDEDQPQPREWAREILRGVEQVANDRPEAMGMLHQDIRTSAAALVEEQEGEDAESLAARQTSINDPRWLLDRCPKSLLGPNGSPLRPWKSFILAAFHNGLQHAEAMGPIKPPEWCGKEPKAPPDGDRMKQAKAFFDSPEYEQHRQSEEYDYYASIGVHVWQRHAPVLRRYLADVRRELLPAGEPEGKDRAEPSDKATMTCTELAEHFGVPKNLLQQRLRRWRRKHDDGWREANNPAPNEALFLYRYGAVKAVCKEAVASHQRHTAKK